MRELLADLARRAHARAKVLIDAALLPIELAALRALQLYGRYGSPVLTATGS